ncbi:hypothetical protein SCLCIDRAFT_753989 [Scleroderma citrinum Foug A]|uniref:Uncharacterized protein n=1 Tax=Scleroderma citrinum Foug A TaxID=1036808 RepID=A0A0C3E4F6_9AGAM|nr:hypothetical protein SCLCIDRAFT_753989 [Scleroderma citrinum Foug A]
MTGRLLYDFLLLTRLSLAFHLFYISIHQTLQDIWPFLSHSFFYKSQQIATTKMRGPGTPSLSSCYFDLNASDRIHIYTPILLAGHRGPVDDVHYFKVSTMYRTNIKGDRIWRIIVEAFGREGNGCLPPSL